MFDTDELTQTLELHQKSYELLKWVARNLKSDAIDFSVAHEAASAFDAAREWMSRHWNNLPDSLRPRKDQLDAFAHLFSSYLTTSFELIERPRRLRQTHCGCWCSYCTYLGRADRLQVKTLSKKAKRSADELKRVYLNSLAADGGRLLTFQQLDELVSDTQLREKLAMVTYAEELIRRTRFCSQGEGVLALWRQFAWNESGSPKPKFKLDPDEILDAEQQVLARIAASESRDVSVSDL